LCLFPLCAIARVPPPLSNLHRPPTPPSRSSRPTPSPHRPLLISLARIPWPHGPPWPPEALSPTALATRILGSTSTVSPIVRLSGGLPPPPLRQERKGRRTRQTDHAGLLDSSRRSSICTLLRSSNLRGMLEPPNRTRPATPAAESNPTCVAQRRQARMLPRGWRSSSLRCHRLHGQPEVKRQRKHREGESSNG
jgi:hypothetical protein